RAPRGSAVRARTYAAAGMGARRMGGDKDCLPGCDMQRVPLDGVSLWSAAPAAALSAEGASERLDSDPDGSRYGCFLPDLTGLAGRLPAPTSRASIYVPPLPASSPANHIGPAIPRR